MHVRRSKCVGTTVFAFILKKAERGFRYRRSLRNSRIFANFPWTAFVWSWSLQCLCRNSRKLRSVVQSGNTWASEGKRGRPKNSTVERERCWAGWQSWNEVHATTQEKSQWRANVGDLCATLAQGVRWRWYRKTKARPKLRCGATGCVNTSTFLMCLPIISLWVNVLDLLLQIDLTF